MMNTYIKLAWRNIVKNKAFSAINIAPMLTIPIGLSTDVSSLEFQIQVFFELFDFEWVFGVSDSTFESLYYCTVQWWQGVQNPVK